MTGINYESDAQEKQKFTNEQLEELANLADRQLELQALIEAANKELTEYARLLKIVSETSIPDIMSLIGMKEFVLESGYKVTVNPYYGASINDENRELCFGWLRDNELSDVIKHEVTAKLGKGSDEAAKAIVDFLYDHHVDYTDKEFVHPQTLKALVKEQCEKDNSEFPKDMFKVYEGKITKISRRK